MSIIKWEPFRDIERLFDEDIFPTKLHKLGWDLAVDLFEEKGNVITEMTLPGVDAEKLEISIEDDHLRIAGSREEEKETKEKNYYSKEIRRGTFERAIRLPSGVNADASEAEYLDGVLRITMPKKAMPKASSIKIKTKVIK